MIWVNKTELIGIFGCSGIHITSWNARALRIYLRTEHHFLIHEIEQLIVSMQSLPFRGIRNIFESKLVKPVEIGMIVCRVLHVHSVNSSLYAQCLESSDSTHKGRWRRADIPRQQIVQYERHHLQRLLCQSQMMCPRSRLR